MIFFNIIIIIIIIIITIIWFFAINIAVMRRAKLKRKLSYIIIVHSTSSNEGDWKENAIEVITMNSIVKFHTILSGRSI